MTNGIQPPPPTALIAEVSPTPDAIAQAEQRGLEAAAKWHDTECSRLNAIAMVGRPAYSTAGLDVIGAVKIQAETHRLYASALRALPLPSAPSPTAEPKP